MAKKRSNNFQGVQKDKELKLPKQLMPKIIIAL